MDTLVANAIGIGLLVSLVFSETMGLAAGGMVVPGYFALNLDHPLRVLTTLLLGLATFVVVRLMSNFIILFGRRRTVVIILVGFLLGAISHRLLSFELVGETVELMAIGVIIPGLVGLWMDRQGVIETTATLLTSAVLVKLLLILIYGGEAREWL